MLGTGEAGHTDCTRRDRWDSASSHTYKSGACIFWTFPSCYWGAACGSPGRQVCMESQTFPRLSLVSLESESRASVGLTCLGQPIHPREPTPAWRRGLLALPRPLSLVASPLLLSSLALSCLRFGFIQVLAFPLPALRGILVTSVHMNCNSSSILLNPLSLG